VRAEEYEALAAFRYALRQFLAFSESAAAAVGLTPQQHQALLAVKGFPGPEPMTIGALAERLRIRHHSTVGLVDRLAAQGLLARHPGRVDRRQVHLALTASGARVLARLSAVHRAELRRIRPRLITLLEDLSGTRV
jgi:DNA-binding MarR family transcriptional regulator